MAVSTRAETVATDKFSQFTNSTNNDSEPVAGPSTVSQAPASSGIQTRQKRILPSRSRRGGPGVGSCDADLMILDTLKRKQENEPLVPAETRLLLTTNSTLVPSDSSNDSFQLQLNTSAYQRYFDKPEVIKAYRDQQKIETPEFSMLAEHATVGGRFRPRSSEDEDADTSDVAYEKRHRKYETFEKRQRLREKEKLQHEHYKLKERIDQLRSMDIHAFLGLPASSFSRGFAPNGPPQDEPVPFDPTGAHAHNLATLHEGEQRKVAMLDAAASLEERYRTLLNLGTDRRKTESRAPSINTSVDPDVHSVVEESVILAGNGGVEEYGAVTPVKTEKIKLKIKWPLRRPAVTPASPKPPSPSKRAAMPPIAITSAPPSQPLKQSESSPLALDPSTPAYAAYSPSPSHGLSIDASSQSPFVNASTSSGAYLARRQPRKRAPDGTFLKKDADLTSWSKEQSVRPRKRLRISFNTADSPVDADDSFDAVESPSSPTTHRRREQSALILSAMRTASAPNARHTQRHVTAFGVKLPPNLETVREFKIPDWALPESMRSFSDEGQDEESTTYSRSDVAVEDILSIAEAEAEGS